MNRLQGKIAIVTGAAGGIGLATAKRFVEEGARVVLSDVSEARLCKVTEGWDAERIFCLEADVSSEQDMRKLTERAVEQFGGLDVMVANAGIEGAVKPITDYSAEEFDRVVAVNLRGAFLSIKFAAPLIAKRGGGAIIVTSSIAGLVGAGGLSAYVASKHGTMGLVKAAAVDLAPLGIRVVSINPGPINNRMMRAIEEKAAPGAAEAVKKGFEEKVPLHRYGENDEVASLVLFLASDESSYCTGVPFIIDGGYTAQ
jgi:NAD(P)-dependent dehydrogenase (short-subunit alcohol dehydrogenase family)